MCREKERGSLGRRYKPSSCFPLCATAAPVPNLARRPSLSRENLSEKFVACALRGFTRLKEALTEKLTLLLSLHRQLLTRAAH